VIEEELEAGVARTTGGKRLKTEVSEREVQETVTLHEENVEVEHTKVDRVLKPEEAAKAFQGTTVEVTATLRDPLIFYFWMPLNDLFDDIDHQMSAYRLLQPSESCRAPQP
jgi:hypothetical protein